MEILALIFAALLAWASFVMYRLWKSVTETYDANNDPSPKNMVVAMVVVTFSATIFPLLGLGYSLYRIIF